MYTKCEEKMYFFFLFFPLAQNDPDSWVVIETNTKTTPGGYEKKSYCMVMGIQFVFYICCSSKIKYMHVIKKSFLLYCN